ncbi:MAG: hypothetical protein KGN76_00675 [Acidobacteriota bacterium]|nr:hypothetical protein [Acidobacteriota bacterium]
MARLKLPPETRGQFAALARLQWQAFINTAFRSLRSGLELVARIPIAIFFILFGLGGATGLGVAAWHVVHTGEPGLLALLVWIVFAFWQLFPLVANTFMEQLDAPQLLRFPLDFRAYALIRVAYGLLGPLPVVGGLWLSGMTLGITVAQPGLLPWTALVLLVFAAFNILLTRTIFSWAERWLAQRRTREIMTVVLFLCLIGFQFSGPLISRLSGGRAVRLRPVAVEIASVQRFLPPGMAAEAVALAARGRPAGALAYAAGLGVCIVAVGWLLGVRLRAEYRGENLSEASARPAAGTVRTAAREGWPTLGLPGPVAAVLEKELRSFMRSPPLVFILLMPLVVLALLLLGTGGPSHGDVPAFMTHAPDLALPIGAAYALALLTNFSYNALGAEGSGVQLYFVMPAAFRRVALGKNLAHTAIIALQVLLVWGVLTVISRAPSAAITAVTFAGLCFALPLELAAGNLLSLMFPKKVDYSTFGRQRNSRVAVLASLVVHSLVFGLIGLTIAGALAWANLWASVPALLVLAGLALGAWALVAGRLDRLALARRETLIEELSRTGGN